MDTSFLQSVLATPIFIAGIGCFVYGLLHPGSIGMLRLSLFSFALQFCMGPAKGILPFQAKISAESADVIMAYEAIYFFWAGAILVGFLWRNRFSTVVLTTGEESIECKGVFAQMAQASIRPSPATLLLVYGLIMLIRTGIGMYYGVGFSGMATLEKTLAMPYPAIVMNSLVHGFGSAFAFVAMTRLVFRQPGSMTSLLILIFEFLYAFTQGRRPMLLICVFVMFAWLLKSRRIQVKHGFIGGAAFLIMWQLVFPFFVMMRDQWAEAGSLQPYMVAEAWTRVISDTISSARKQDEYRVGVEDRLNALALNYTVANRLNNGVRPVRGLFVKMAFISLIPRILFEEKLLYAGEPDERLNEEMNIPGRDQMSNLPVFALADFGALGGFLYGIIFGCGIRFVGSLLCILFARSPLGAACIFSMICAQATLQMEMHLNSFLGLLRNITVAFIMIIILNTLFGRKQEEPMVSPAIA